MLGGIKRTLLQWAQIIIGLLSATTAYRMFLIPNDIAPGGFTGIGQLINSATGWPVGTIALCLNIPLFLVSLRSLGLRFGLRSLVASVALSMMIDFLPIPPVIPENYTEHMILSAIFGGVLGGAGFGLIIRGSATTGGSDMLAKLIHERLPFVTIGSIMFAVDALVILASAFVFDVVSAMFALICVFLMSYITDLVVDGLNSARAYFIISGKCEEIAGHVLKDLERGATALSARGMYSGEAKEVLLCVVNRTESIYLRSVVASIDPNAFMIATNVHEALGEGFKPHAYTKKRNPGTVSRP